MKATTENQVEITDEELDLILLSLNPVREYLMEWLKDWTFETPKGTQARIIEEEAFNYLKKCMSLVDPLENKLRDFISQKKLRLSLATE